MGEEKAKRELAKLREGQLLILSRVNQKINENLEIDAILRALVEAALELSGASDGAAGLFLDGQMVFKEYYHQGQWVPIDFSFPPGHGVPGWVMENKRAYVSNDAANDPVVLQDIRQQLGFYNLADTPILDRNGEILGCFEIHNTHNARPFDEQDIAQLQGLSASAAVAMENAGIIENLKKTQAELKESKSYLRSLFEESPVSLWEEDFSEVKVLLDGLKRQGVEDLEVYLRENPRIVMQCANLARVTDVNRATVELFEAKSKTDLLANLDQVFTESSFESFCEELISLATGKDCPQASATNKTLGGKKIEVAIKWSILPGYQESWEKVVVSMVDVTREREIDRMKNEFISTAAHELRTPLSVLMGYAELLLMGEAQQFKPEEKREYLEYIYAKGMSLERIIDDLLDVGRIETGRSLMIETSQVQFSELLAEICRNHQRESIKHSIQVTLPAPDVCLLADPGKLTQVIDNLLGNAVKYSPDGGAISVVGKVAADYLSVSITDRGIGMTEQQCSRAFDKFYRGDNSNTAPRGLGLGLNIAQNIVAAHGGSIELKSAVGKGTTVSFKVQLVAPQEHIET